MSVENYVATHEGERERRREKLSEMIPFEDDFNLTLRAIRILNVPADML